MNPRLVREFPVKLDQRRKRIWGTSYVFFPSSHLGIFDIVLVVLEDGEGVVSKDRHLYVRKEKTNFYKSLKTTFKIINLISLDNGRD